MTNPNDPTSFKREVSQDSFNDVNGHTHVTRTDTTVNNPDAYKDGYVEGRVEENRYQENVLVERDNDNASRGLLLGILLTSLAALTAGAIWYFNQRNEVPAPVAPTILVPSNPPDPSPSPEVNQPPQTNTTIIREVPVVVPQQQAPAPQAPAAPDINISVPSSAPQSPATQPAPATQTSPSSTDTQPQSSTDTTTPTQGTSTQPETTSGNNSSTTDPNTNTNPPQ